MHLDGWGEVVRELVWKCRGSAQDVLRALFWDVGMCLEETELTKDSDSLLIYASATCRKIYESHRDNL